MKKINEKRKKIDRKKERLFKENIIDDFLIQEETDQFLFEQPKIGDIIHEIPRSYTLL